MVTLELLPADAINAPLADIAAVVGAAATDIVCLIL